MLDLNKPRLTEAEKQSELWKNLERMLNDRLRKHRVSLESDVDERQSDRLRGRIREIKFLLALAESPDPAQQQTPDYLE